MGSMGSSLCATNEEELVDTPALPTRPGHGPENEMTSNYSLIDMVASNMKDDHMSRVLKGAIKALETKSGRPVYQVEIQKYLLQSKKLEESKIGQIRPHLINLFK